MNINTRNIDTILDSHCLDHIIVRYTSLDADTAYAEAWRREGADVWDAEDGEGQRIGIIRASRATGKFYSQEAADKAYTCDDDPVQALQTLVKPYAIKVWPF